MREGQLLATLEDRDLVAAAQESKQLYMQAQATYETTKAATMPDDLVKARTDAQSAREGLDAARTLYDNRVSLLRQGAIAQKLVDDAKVALVQAQSQEATAAQHLQSLQTVGRPEQLKSAAAQMEAAKAHYESAAAQVSYSEVRSPISGVVADRPVNIGEMASSGSALFSIVDVSRVVARINVPVREAADIHVGRPASIATPAGALPGKVTVVSPAVDPNTTTVQVWVEAVNKGERLKPGVTAQISMDIGEIPNAIVVPATALLASDEGGEKVMIAGTDGLAHESKVKVGVRNGDDVQILSGVKAGDKVITEGGLGLDDKAKIQIAKPGEEDDKTANSRAARPTQKERPPRTRNEHHVRTSARASFRRGDVQHWTARYLKSVIFIVIALSLFGVYLALSIPIAVFPATNFPRIVVGIDNGVMPIDQMQVTVTRPIEEAVNSVPGLDHVVSVTSRGSADVDLFFNWKVDMFQTLQYVNAAVARVQPTLPSTAAINTNRLTFAAFPIMGYSMVSASLPQTRLWELATYTLKPRLNRLPGVSTVVVQGGQEPEFQITPDPEKLVESQITIPSLLDAFSKTNMIDSPGFIQRDHQLVLSLVNGQAQTPDDIGAMVAKTTSSGSPIHIRDVAAVTQSVKPVFTIVTANGKPAVLLNVFRQPDSNTVTVADEIHADIAQLSKSLPAGVTLQSFYDQSLLVSDSIKSVRDAILIGLVLAAVILVLFLRDWGTSIVAGLVIPATVALTLIVMRAFGESFNLMTLGGLAAAVGLIIDDAIVVVENIVMHRDNGQTRSEAIRLALKEIRVPLVGSTITPIVVFLPLVSVTGVTGTFFRALAITVGVALLTSLLLALSWTPALSYALIRSHRRAGTPHSEVATTGILGSLTRFYARTLHAALAHPFVLTIASLCLIAVSFFSYNSIGSDLLPAIDEGSFVLDYLMPAGASLDDTNRVLIGVENILHGIPEVESTSRRTGLQLGFSPVTEPNTGDISVMLKAKRSRSVDEVIADVRQQVNKRYPQLDTDFTQILQDQIGDLTSSPDPVEIKLFSENIPLLQQWAPRIADAIKTISAVKDIKNGIDDTVSGPAVTFNVNQSIAARSGFTTQELELDASAILDGEPATVPVIRNGRPYTLRVRFPDSTRASLESIGNTPLISGTGHTATLGSVAEITNDPGQLEIRRENLQRFVAVTARLEGVSLGTGIQLVQQKVNALHVPSAIRIAYGGLYAQQQQSFHDLLFVLAAAVILVFIVLLIEFGGFAAPIAILASAILSTSGVFLALLITGTTFNLSSFMGLIMVVGIVAKNGILLLDADQRYRSEGLSPREAMIQAGERRLRPILMTALATVAGMIPLALAFGAGSQMLQPLAIAIIGGILASMVLSLVVTPAVHYALAHKES